MVSRIAATLLWPGFMFFLTFVLINLHRSPTVPLDLDIPLCFDPCQLVQQFFLAHCPSSHQI